MQTATGFAFASAIPSGAHAQAEAVNSWQTTIQMPADKPKRLFIKNQRTGEIFNDIIEQGAIIFDDALIEIDHLLRDWRRDETITMDRDLINLLAAIQNEAGHAEPITIISGYRSKKTNEMLRRKMRKVAKNSYHIKGMAVDLHIKGVSTSALRKMAVQQSAGGVGYYPRKGFVHIDTGPVRSWRA